jgi:hypothetical protein
MAAASARAALSAHAPVSLPSGPGWGLRGKRPGWPAACCRPSRWRRRRACEPPPPEGVRIDEERRFPECQSGDGEAGRRSSQCENRARGVAEHRGRSTGGGEDGADVLDLSLDRVRKGVAAVAAAPWLRRRRDSRITTSSASRSPTCPRPAPRSRGDAERPTLACAPWSVSRARSCESPTRRAHRFPADRRNGSARRRPSGWSRPATSGAATARRSGDSRRPGRRGAAGRLVPGEGWPERPALAPGRGGGPRPPLQSGGVNRRAISAISS